MPTPRKGYWLNGKRLPSVTTILNRLDDQTNLARIAVNISKEGQCPFTLWRSAANVGSAVHLMIETYLEKGGAGLSSDMSKELKLSAKEWEEAKTAFRPFLHWVKSTNLGRPYKQELSLMSEEHEFGGTFDCLYKNDDGYIICDWKTSKSSRMSHLYQMAAYGILVEENLGKVAGYYLIRFDKEQGTFDHKYYPELNGEREQFLKTLEIYARDKELSKRRGLP